MTGGAESWGSETILEGTITVETRHYTQAKPVECTP